MLALKVAEACKAAGSGSIELLEMDAGSKESVTAVAKAVEGRVCCPPINPTLLHRVSVPVEAASLTAATCKSRSISCERSCGPLADQQYLPSARAQVSVLVNNAGIARAFGISPLELDPDDLDDMIAVNLAAPMRLVALLAPGMAKKGNGVIINVSSVAGIDPKPHAIGYASSKWGMTG